MAVPGQLTVTAAPGGRKAGPVVTWADASLRAGQSVTYTITFKVAARARGTVVIAAVASSQAVKDPRPANNTAVAAVRLG